MVVTWFTMKGGYYKLNTIKVLRKIFEPIYNIEKGRYKETSYHIYQNQKDRMVHSCMEG